MLVIAKIERVAVGLRITFVDPVNTRLNSLSKSTVINATDANI